jgi:hypothetical protein
MVLSVRDLVSGWKMRRPGCEDNDGLPDLEEDFPAAGLTGLRALSGHPGIYTDRVFPLASVESYSLLELFAT